MRGSPALLALETGDLFFGHGFGSAEPREGEVVFNTSMTGYQEISTDASYHGQIVTLTYPLIDNYGVNADDVESRRPWIAGLAVRELAATHSNWRASGGLHDYLAKHGIPGIQGIDTRALTRVLRTAGPQRGVIARAPAEAADGAPYFRWATGRWPGAADWADAQVQAARKAIRYGAQTFVDDVTTPDRFVSDEAAWAPWPEPSRRDWSPRIVVLDVGVKTNIVRSLARRGCQVHVVPYGADAERHRGAGTRRRGGLQRAGRPATSKRGGHDDSRPGGAVSTDRDLPGTSAARAGDRRDHEPPAVRAPRREPIR